MVSSKPQLHENASFKHFSAIDDPFTYEDESAVPLGDTGELRLCSSILDTLWHRAEVSINQVCNEGLHIELF